MPRAVAIFLRHFPLPVSSQYETAKTIPSEHSRLSTALVVSLLLHLLPVALLVFLLPRLQGNAVQEQSTVLYSVLLEKKRQVITSVPTTRSNAQSSQARRSGNAELDLTGEHRVMRATYEMLLASRIEKQRYYPQRARQLRQEGQPIVRIVIDPQGQAKQIAIEASSGVALLDEAALDIVRKAQPFPAPPAEYVELLRQYGDGNLVFRAPIVFSLAQTR